MWSRTLLALAWLAVLAAGMLAPATPARAAANLELGPLLADVAGHTTPRARFYERKYISLLDAPVDSTGELLFIAPLRLEKHTLSPQRESLVIDGDALTLERGGVRRVMSLQQLPEALPLVDSLRATLGGDRQMLERHFQVTLAGSLQRWVMTLVPRDARALKLVRQVKLSGERNGVNLVEIDQTDGDRSVMRVLPTP